MTLNPDYKDFRAYKLKDEGDKEEFDVEIDNISSFFTSEAVLLLVRYDLRRIYIWKGPKSPVRKRFISSRVGSKIQEESSKIGMHLKIVSVDAGDEPVEFLRSFNVESYVVSEDEKPEDMYYIRNEERRKLEEEELLKGKTEKDSEKKEYWSPALEDAKRAEKIEKAKKKAVETTQDIAASIGQPVKKKSLQSSYTPNPLPTSTNFNSSTRRSTTPMSNQAEKEILDLILQSEELENMTRMNIIIGNSVYSPKRTISALFGKEVEEIQWAKMENIPDGNIDIKSHFLRVFCKNNQIQGIEIFQAENLKDKDAPKQKKLKEIPSG